MSRWYSWWAIGLSAKTYMGTLQLSTSTLMLLGDDAVAENMTMLMPQMRVKMCEDLAIEAFCKA